MQKVKLSEIYEGLYDGPHATPKPSENGPIFLGIKNITTDGRLDLSTVRHISDNEFSKWTKRVTPQAGDIVFSYEATLHRYAIIPEGFNGCLGRRMALIRPNEKKINTEYLFNYFFTNQWLTEVTKYILSGSTVDRIPLTKVPEFELVIHERKKQDEIAKIITNYNNLIENNNRRIAILEDMAQSLYREWFVHFRFPGHKNCQFKESELGRIPEGWEYKPLVEVLDKIIDYRGKTPKKLGGDWIDKGIKALSALNVKNGSLIRLDACKQVDFEMYEKWMKVKLKDGDILLTSEAPLGEVAILQGNTQFCLSQRLFALRAKDENVSPEYIFIALFSGHLVSQLLSRATGATVAGIRQSLLKEVPILVPPKNIMGKFTTIAINLLQQKSILWQKNNNLKKQRDMLLPKLISGKIEV